MSFAIFVADSIANRSSMIWVDLGREVGDCRFGIRSEIEIGLLRFWFFFFAWEIGEGNNKVRGGRAWLSGCVVRPRWSKSSANIVLRMPCSAAKFGCYCIVFLTNLECPVHRMLFLKRIHKHSYGQPIS